MLSTICELLRLNHRTLFPHANVLLSDRMNICVFCSSNRNTPSIYRIAAEELGERLATRGHTLVFGGGNVGLMHEVAHSAIKSGGAAVGIIPEYLRSREQRFENGDELILTDTIHERKHLMVERADAFIVLPGGFGTLEELLEVVAMRYRDSMQKPIALLNTAGFYNQLFGFFDFLSYEQFVPSSWREDLFVSEESNRILDYIEYHVPDSVD